jgi:PadR family transcriptional regulator PadR
MNREPLLTGQIDMLLLSVVARGPSHGYAIIEQLRLRSRGAFELREGTVYPALYRLERAGLLSSAVGHVAGRPRRTYRLTGAGLAALRERRDAWRELVRSVNAVLKGAPTLRHG